MTRYTIDELDINEYVGFAASHVGETRELEFQTFSKRGEAAGKYEILDFEKDENPRFTYHYWRHEENRTPDSAVLGWYKIRLTETKYYNGKTFWFPVTAYVQDEYKPEGDHARKTRDLFINNAPRETNKRLKAYEFGIIDFKVNA